ALALLILLDQIPRNVFRNSAHAYATDPLARYYARRAIEAGFDKSVEPDLRTFFYLPFEHSEDLADQERALALYRPLPASQFRAGAPDHVGRAGVSRCRRFLRLIQSSRISAATGAIAPSQRAYCAPEGCRPSATSKWRQCGSREMSVTSTKRARCASASSRAASLNASICVAIC